jgi:hypothetical protein
MTKPFKNSNRTYHVLTNDKDVPPMARVRGMATELSV